MANSTRRTAQQIHGTNPQFLIEKVIRSRIYDSEYWKEHCFALTAETVVDRSLKLDAVGGTYGVQKPCPFLCLVLKLLQLQPQKEILLVYLEAKEFKYLRAIAAFYIRLTFPPIEVYTLLEPLLEDYRKLRFRRMDGGYSLTHMDEFVDELLTQERVCSIILPRLTRRDVLEELEGLEPRISMLEDALMQGSDGEDEGEDGEDDTRRRWKEKLQRKRDARRKRELNGQTHGAISLPQDNADDEDEGYVSQEESDEEGGAGGRYVSRSPSRSVSPDRERYVSRSPSRSRSPEDGQQQYVSRSPSRSASPNGQRYVSRSPSRSASPA